LKKALWARNLGVSFGKIAALEAFDLDLHPGERVALLGPNGAGKTTLLRTLLGVLLPTSGQTNAAEFHIGSVLEQPGLPRHAMSSSYLLLHARLLGVPDFDVQAELARAGVPDRAWHTLSLGQKQQLQLSRSLIRQPELLFLDEPTSNLDPLARQELWERLEDWNGKGGALLWATHDLSEAREHAHRILVMNQGRLRWAGTPADFETAYPPGWKFCPDTNTVLELTDRESVHEHLSRQLAQGAIPHSFGPDPKGLLLGYAQALNATPLGSQARENLMISPLPPPAFMPTVAAIANWEMGLLRHEPRIFLPFLILGALFLAAQSATPMLLPTMFLLPMGLCASLACDLVAGERERQSLDTLLATRIPAKAALLAKLLTSWLAGWLPGLVLTLLACLISHTSAWPAMLELTLGTLTATSLAARLAVTSKSVRSATQLSVLATLAVSLTMTAPLFLPWNLLPILTAAGLLLPPALLVSASRKFVP
jgi:ABC-type multidrug transport system ATPase subunit